MWYRAIFFLTGRTMRWQDLLMRHRSAGTNAERVPFFSQSLERTNMHTIHLPHPVLAPAAAAMETALHFGLVDEYELQSYRVEPIALGFALIGRYGDDLRSSPAAAYMCWDDAHYIATIDPDSHYIDVWDVSANAVCIRAGHTDLADMMLPVHRTTRQAYKPDMGRIRTVMSDTIFEALEVREKQSRDIEREMRA